MHVDHYGDKETMDSILILHEVQSNIIIFCGDVQVEMVFRVDLLLKIITKVHLVTTMVTKRPCTPVTQINGFSGMTYPQIDIPMHILRRYSLW